MSVFKHMRVCVEASKLRISAPEESPIPNRIGGAFKLLVTVPEHTNSITILRFNGEILFQSQSLKQSHHVVLTKHPLQPHVFSHTWHPFAVWLYWKCWISWRICPFCFSAKSSMNRWTALAQICFFNAVVCSQLAKQGVVTVTLTRLTALEIIDFWYLILKRSSETQCKHSLVATTGKQLTRLCREVRTELLEPF